MEENKKNKIPNVPNKRKLKELVSFGLGLTYTPRYLANGIPFISSKNISNDYLDLSDINFISLDEFNGCSKSAKPKYGDILFTRVGSNLGHPVVYESTNDICIFVSLGFLRCKDLINNYYLKHWMNSPNFWQQVRKKVGGSSKFNLNTGWLQEFDVPYRDFEEQQKIAFFLNKIDERIRTQNKIIEEIKNQIKYIEEAYFSGLSCEWTKLSDLVKSGAIKLFRGNIIPKHERDSNYKYPVYSSSVNNMGLMGFYNSYMFDEELITWSIDGGGNFFYREKHKFNVTNVCGYIRTTKYDYRFLTECLIWQHRKQKFDYQSKAHPSVIASIYKVPNIDINKQKQFSYLIEKIYKKLDTEEMVLNLYNEQKKYLLDNLFI